MNGQQACIAFAMRGEPETFEAVGTDVHALHARMIEDLAEAGGRIDAFYHAPHHPEAATMKRQLSNWAVLFTAITTVLAVSMATSEFG